MDADFPLPLHRCHLYTRKVNLVYPDRIDPHSLIIHTLSSLLDALVATDRFPIVQVSKVFSITIFFFRDQNVNKRLKSKAASIKIGFVQLGHGSKFRMETQSKTNLDRIRSNCQHLRNFPLTPRHLISNRFSDPIGVSIHTTVGLTTRPLNNFFNESTQGAKMATSASSATQGVGFFSLCSPLKRNKPTKRRRRRRTVVTFPTHLVGRHP